MEDVEKKQAEPQVVVMLHKSAEPPDENDPPSPHDDLNVAMEWLHYCRGSAQVLADYILEGDAGPERVSDMNLAAEAIVGMIREACQRIARAHTGFTFDYMRRDNPFPI